MSNKKDKIDEANVEEEKDKLGITLYLLKHEIEAAEVDLQDALSNPVPRYHLLYSDKSMCLLHSDLHVGDFLRVCSQH